LDPLLLYGQFERDADSKSRILIPAEVRKRINPDVHGKNFFLIIGQNKRPWLYPDKYYEFLAGRMTPDIAPGAEATDFDRYSFSLAEPVELDGQGRILIPAKTLAWAGLENRKKFFLIGVRDHLELWDVADWESERRALLARGPEIVSRVRQTRQTT
jgi:MraZ protein